MQVIGECSAAANMFIIELDLHFVDSKLVNAIGIVYPQFGCSLMLIFLSLHMAIIKKHYCEQ